MVEERRLAALSIADLAHGVELEEVVRELAPAGASEPGEEESFGLREESEVVPDLPGEPAAEGCRRLVAAAQRRHHGPDLGIEPEAGGVRQRQGEGGERRGDPAEAGEGIAERREVRPPVRRAALLRPLL